MTLVLACLTDWAVYQISDRRLTRLSDASQVLEDERNKAVVVNGRAAFAYSGLAYIGDRRTDVWLAKTIVEGETRNFREVAERVRSSVTDEFQKMTASKATKRHAFQAVGWFRRGPTNVEPGLVVIENALNPDGSWMREARDEFAVSHLFPGDLNGSCMLFGVGQTCSAAEREAVFRLLRKCVKHRRATHVTVISALTVVMRWLHRRYPRIGPNLISVCIPWGCVDAIQRTGDMSIRLGSPDDEHSVNCTYVSQSASDVYYAPHWIADRTVRFATKLGPQRFGPDLTSDLGIF